MARMWKLLLFMLACGLALAEEHWVALDPQEKFNVSWSIEDTTPSSYITFTITCMTTGWVGLGFSPKGSMKDADIVIAWVDADGSPNILDMYATANGVPVKDMSQDVELISATEADGVTTVSFKRKLNTCDKVADNIITSSTTRLIYAYKDADPVDADSISGSDYHTSRGVRSLYLLEQKSTNMQPPEDALTVDFAMNNYAVPSDTDTTYYCKFFNPPELDSKHHITSFETVVQAGNEPVVHHLVLYGCTGVEQEHIRNNNKTEGVCHTDEMPEFYESCGDVVYAWAVGGGPFHFPEKAGFPMGGSDGTAVQYYMMEMHYDNPDLLDTWVDSSFVRITYTPTLREEDVGYLSMGSVDGIAVPPRPDKFRTVGYCDGSCTEQWIPEEGIELFSYLLHSHLLGVAIRVDWYRDGKHVGVLAHDDNYDFNFQDVRHFRKNKKLYPGDTLKITCTYSDPDKDVVTFGGLPSSSEMCLAYFGYYPRQLSASCASFAGLLLSPDDPVYEALSISSTHNETSYGKFVQIYEVSDWTDGAVSALQDAYDVSNHYSACYKTSLEEYESSFQTIDPAMYPNPKKVDKEDKTCKKVEDVYDTASHSSGAVLLLFLALMLTVMI